MDGVWDEIQYLSVKLKTLNQVGWGAIALDGFPGLWRMAFDVLVTQHLWTFVGLRCRLTQPTKTLNRTILG
jgi:hypothetical protein